MSETLRAIQGLACLILADLPGYRFHPRPLGKPVGAEDEDHLVSHVDAGSESLEVVLYMKNGNGALQTEEAPFLAPATLQLGQLIRSLI